MLERADSVFVIENGCLKMDDYDLDHLADEIEDGGNPKEVLKTELEMVGLNIKDVFSIQLNGKQLANRRYVETYAKIICDFWNS